MGKLGQSLLFGTCLIALGGALAARGEQSPSSSDAGQAPAGEIGEIVVTALRRSERLQDVPVSISVLSGTSLSQEGLRQVTDLGGRVPNLQVSTVGGDSIPVFSLRGISMVDYGPNQQGPVATYFDEVYRGSLPMIPVGMFDLERVEVLRGPQGTLYGKNTTGGAINFISHKPDFKSEGYLKLGYGNYGRFDAEGAAQLPLGDQLAARVAFTYSKADGYIKNLLPGKSDMSSVREFGIRASLLYKPSDRLDFLLRLSTSFQNPISPGVYAVPGPLGVGGGVYELVGGHSYFPTTLGRWETASNFTPKTPHRTYGATLTTNWKASDQLTLTSVTSYDYGNISFNEDGDGSPLSILSDEVGGKVNQFSQDLRLASSFDGPLNYIAGVYYNRESGHYQAHLTYYGDVDLTGDGIVDVNDCLQTFFIACTSRNDYRQIRKSTAVYGDVNFKLSERVILRGGLRYTRDTGDIPSYTAQLLASDGTPIANTIPGDPVNFDATTGIAFRKGTVTGKVGIDYKMANDNLLYVSVSRGYRANAFNSQAYLSPVELNVAEPETVNAYELGFKSQFMNRTLTFNGAMFYYDYKNQQALNVDSQTLVQTEVNIPKSRILGAEFELALRPIDSLRINASLGLLSTKVKQGAVSGVVIEGNRLPNAPNASATLGFDYDVMHSDAGRLTLSLDGTYTSKQYFELFNIERMAQHGYGLVNGQLNFRTASDRFGVGIWGKNLLDKFYTRYAIDLSGFGYDYYHLGNPRTFGITVDAKF